jgi:hypothetical protein
MPVKVRIAKDRRPSFSRETLALFVELERTSPRRRKTTEFIAKSKRLAGLLGLSAEWWTMQHVEDDNRFRPQPGLIAHADWLTVRRVRAQLLAAAGLGDAAVEGKPRATHASHLVQ